MSSHVASRAHRRRCIVMQRRARPAICIHARHRSRSRSCRKTLRRAPDLSDENTQLAPRLQKQIVDYPSREAPGTVIIDTPHTFLYYVLGNGKAIRYGIGVGREGFTWSGVKAIARKTEWPDWYPPQDMISRQPYLPRMIAGGPGNPLGARAMYIGGTEYRIHGTNDPSSIGRFVLMRLHPHDQRQRHRSLQSRADRRQGDRAADARRTFSESRGAKLAGQGASRDRGKPANGSRAHDLERRPHRRPLLTFRAYLPAFARPRAGHFFACRSGAAVRRSASHGGARPRAARRSSS